MGFVSIEKILSRNDVSATGGHQAGILVPKKRELLNFFPLLDAARLNPRLNLIFHDDFGNSWGFVFIYYNNRLHVQDGTRNEYRLTCMTPFLRRYSFSAGDVIIFRKYDNGRLEVAKGMNDVAPKSFGPAPISKVHLCENGNENVLVLSRSWRIIRKKL